MDVHFELRMLGLGPRSIKNAVQLLKLFLHHLPPTGCTQAAEDGEEVDQQQSRMELARKTWSQISDQRGWSKSYRKKALTNLSRALEVTGEVLLARTLNVQSKPRQKTVTTSSSHETRFLLHDCLPVSVRSKPVTSVLYQVFFRLGELMVRHLRSTCRHTLQKKLLFILRIIQTGERPLLITNGCEDEDFNAAWERLQNVSAVDWLGRFDLLHAGGRPLREKTFQMYLTTLRQLHEDILGPRKDNDVIPVANAASAMDISDGEEDDEKKMNNDQTQRKQLLSRLKTRLCGDLSLSAAPPRSSFNPEEVISILDSAVTSKERLIVMLLMTTGLRLGGLCRLRSSVRVEWGAEVPPDALSTVEKGNKMRMPVLVVPVKILLARYFREERPPMSAFLFPAPTMPEKAVHQTNMWKTIKDIFRRAKVTGRHAHPHTFRHTYVHMLRLLGVPTDVIAKLVGHSNLQTTEKTYSRFEHDEMAALTASIPLFGSSVALERDSLKERWKTVQRRLLCPYEFSEKEWHRLKG